MGWGFKAPLDLLASLGFDRLAAPCLRFLPPTKMIERSPCLWVCRLADLFIEVSSWPTVVAAKDAAPNEVATNTMKATRQKLILLNLWSI